MLPRCDVLLAHYCWPRARLGSQTSFAPSPMPVVSVSARALATRSSFALSMALGPCNQQAGALQSRLGDGPVLLRASCVRSGNGAFHAVWAQSKLAPQHASNLGQDKAPVNYCAPDVNTGILWYTNGREKQVVGCSIGSSASLVGHTSLVRDSPDKWTEATWFSLLVDCSLALAWCVRVSALQRRARCW